jgi:hypothetical protein
MALYESLQDRQEVVLRVITHLCRLVHRVLAVAQEIDEPLVKDPVRVVRGFLDARREMAVAEKQGGLLQNGAQDVEVERLGLTTLRHAPEVRQRGDMVELRRIAVLFGKQVAVRPPISLQDVLQRTAYMALQLVVQDVEEQRVMGGHHRLDRALCLAVELDEVVADDDRVVFVEGRNRVVDISVFDPLVCFGPVECELEDGEEEAPDEDVLLAARDLDSVHLIRPGLVALAAQDTAGETSAPDLAHARRTQSRS